MFEIRFSNIILFYLKFFYFVLVKTSETGIYECIFRQNEYSRLYVRVNSFV